ncbi:MAG: hypothetical protein SPL39_11915 [Selenomonadaceae bacterium]|nr:hypothetical protein [Selenomonadaceae bacterium]
MIPVLVGLGVAIGGAVIASQSRDSEGFITNVSGPAPEANDTKSSKRVVDESEVPAAVRQHISAQEHPTSEKTSKRVIDESDVPKEIREKIASQEQSQAKKCKCYSVVDESGNLVSQEQSPPKCKCYSVVDESGNLL